MTKLFSDLRASKADALKALERDSGLDLIGQFGKSDFDDEFELDGIRSELNGDDFKAYIFAIEHVILETL